MDPNQAVDVYVDGSFIDGRVGYGAVALQAGRVLMEWSGTVPESHTGNARNVAGELYAVGVAVNELRKLGVQQAVVYHDYQGISSWALGQWKTKTDLTKRYKAFITQQPVQVRFQKVKAHSGNTWNDRADALARKGASGGQALQQVATADTVSSTESASETYAQQLNRVGPLVAQRLQEDAGLNAHFAGVFNGQYARLEVLDANSDRLGLLDVYHTAQKPWKARAHAFAAKADAELVRQTWERFYAAELAS